MKTRNRLIQAYQQLPWRNQAGRLVLAFFLIVCFVMIAIIYLDVGGRVALYGRWIQDANWEIEQNEIAIKGLETNLAEITSVKMMDERAISANYHRIKNSEMLFLEVNNFPARQEADLSAIFNNSQNTNTLPREYTLSLVEWIQQLFQNWVDGYIIS